jgi:hypothetical protein
MIWLVLYALGTLGFGGLLFALGRDDHSWPVLALMAVGWLPLIVVLGLIALLAKLLGDMT